jgi:hypothetical protein
MDEEWKKNAQRIQEEHYKEAQRLQEAFEDRRLLSIHEAGHAIVAEHFKMGVVRIVVIAPNRSFTEIPNRQPIKETLSEDVTMTFGAYYAVLKETNDQYIANVHCGLDNKFLFDLLSAFSVSEKERKELEKNARILAKQLVEKHWLAIKKIADEVFEHQQISGARVREILSETSL